MNVAADYATDLTVNEAKHRGLLLGIDLLADQARRRIIICGDSSLVIRQMRGEIDCKAPGLQLLRHKAIEKLRSWPIHDFLHMKRNWNQSADRLATNALQQEKGTMTVSDQDRQNLHMLNQLDELLTPKNVNRVVKISAVTRSAVRRRRLPEVMQDEVVQRIRIERIKQAQKKRVGSPI